MSLSANNHIATVEWTRTTGAPFTDLRYPRAHVWRFDGGAVVPASSAPSSVKVPLSDPAAVDPEEALVAAVSSCHMLFFLAFAAGAGLVVDSYRDEAVGRLGPIGNGRKAMAEITLRPAVAFSGSVQPSEAVLADLHHRAHDACYIANSLKTPVVVAPAQPVFA